MNITNLYCWVTFSNIMREYVYRYNIAITLPKYKYIGGIIQVSRLVLWENICLTIE